MKMVKRITKILPLCGVLAGALVWMCVGGHFLSRSASEDVQEQSSASVTSAKMTAKATAAQTAAADRQKAEEQQKRNAQKQEEEKKLAEKKKKAEERARAYANMTEEERKDADLFWTDDMVDEKWFDDAIFVGDSISDGLSYYCDNGVVGDAAFLCKPCLGYNSALWDLNDPNAIHPTWKGKKVTVDEGVRLSGKKKVFMMFGMNDLGVWGVDTTVESMQKMAHRILKKCPDVEFYIEGVNPMLPEYEKEEFNNRMIAEYNLKLKKACELRGYHFIDFTPAVCDEQGNLALDYCMDPDYMGQHLNNDGCERWVKYLKAHVLDEDVQHPHADADIPEEEPVDEGPTFAAGVEELPAVNEEPYSDGEQTEDHSDEDDDSENNDYTDDGYGYDENGYDGDSEYNGYSDDTDYNDYDDQTYGYETYDQNDYSEEW